MWRVIAFFVVTAGLAFGLAQFADQPGLLELEWGGYRIETSLYVGVIALAVLFAVLMIIWSLLRALINSPRAIAKHRRERREQQGRQALSRGMVAVGAGDRAAAQRYCNQAVHLLQHEPLVGLLKAQTAQLRGDHGAARREFQAMLDRPETEALGLRGLFLEGRSAGDLTSAMQFAERAMRINPALPWATTATLEMQCTHGNWDGALRTIAIQKQHKQITKQEAARKRAVVLAGQALNAEDTDADKALRLAQEAAKLAPGLVPAADLAARQLTARGSAAKAARLLEKAWREMPHPDIAAAYAHVRAGDSARDRLKRVQHLAKLRPQDPESHIAVATAAVEAHEWDTARDALQAFVNDRPSQRVCTLMARIEGGDKGDRGLVREWLARAVRAPRDPAWVADGHVSERWAPVSPVTGRLDAYRWEVPQESLADGPDELTLESFVEHQLEAVEFADKSPQDGEGPAEPEPAAARPMTAAAVGSAAVAGGVAAASSGPDAPAPAAEDVADAEPEAVPPVAEPEPAPAETESAQSEDSSEPEPEPEPEPKWEPPAFLMRVPEVVRKANDDGDRPTDAGASAPDAEAAAPKPAETDDAAFIPFPLPAKEGSESAEAETGPADAPAEAVNAAQPARSRRPAYSAFWDDPAPPAEATAEDMGSDAPAGPNAADGASTDTRSDGTEPAQPVHSRRPAYSAFWDEPASPGEGAGDAPRNPD